MLHCPFCHGWEVRDQRIAVLGRNENALHRLILFRQLSARVTLFHHDAPVQTEEQSEQLAALNVPIVTTRVERLIVEGNLVCAVQTEGGRQFETDVVVAPQIIARTEVFKALEGERNSTPFGEQITADPRGATMIPGVWVGGNAGDVSAMIVAGASTDL